MGRIFRKRGRLWVDYRDHRKKRVRKPAKGCRTERQAETHLAELEAEARDAARDIARGVYDGRTNHVEVAGLVEAYLLHQLATKRYATTVATRTALTGTVGHFLRPGKGKDGRPPLWPPRRQTPLEDVAATPHTFVPGPLGAEVVADITPERLEEWAAVRRDLYATRTLNMRIKTLKACLNWAAEQGRIQRNPIATVSRVGRPAERQWRALTEAEATALLDASPEPYQTVWLAFLTTGMRHGELVKLRWADVSLPTNTIRVRQEASKTDRQRDIPMVPELRARLERLHGRTADPDGPVFVNADGGAWVNNLGARFKKCAQAAGLVSRIVWRGRQWHLEYTEDGRTVREALDATTRRDAEAARRQRRGRQDKRVVIHGLRHTYATALIRKGVNVKVVQELLGHTTVQMTLQVYSHVFPKDKQTAVAVLEYGTYVAPPPERPSQVATGTST